MSADGQPLETQFVHDRDLVAGHRAFRLDIGPGIRFPALSVAPKVGHDDGEHIGRFRCHGRPAHLCLRPPLEKEQRRSAAPNERVDADPITSNPALFEAFNDP